MSVFMFGPFKDKSQKKQVPASKHEKLAENWGHNAGATKEGATFHMNYLGSTLLEELEEGKSYGNNISAEAVKTIVTMAKASGRKITKMTLRVSPHGITVINSATQQVHTQLDIHRIHFCTADKNHSKVFAYIARSTENETMECHAFLCAKRKIAQAVTLTVAESFQIAKTKYEKEEEEEEKKKYEAVFTEPAQDVSHVPSDVPSEMPSSAPCEVATGILINLEPEPQPTPQQTQQQHQHQQQQQQQQQQQLQQMGFEDNFADTFASFSGNPPEEPNPFARNRFSVGLEAHEVDDMVRSLMNSGASERHPSTDDDLL